jgi:hypothetical protein
VFERFTILAAASPIVKEAAANSLGYDTHSGDLFHVPEFSALPKAGNIPRGFTVRGD